MFKFSQKLCVITTVLMLASCSSAYYSAMEKVGIHKRDIMVDRVVDADRVDGVARGAVGDRRGVGHLVIRGFCTTAHRSRRDRRRRRGEKRGEGWRLHPS